MVARPEAQHDGGRGLYPVGAVMGLRVRQIATGGAQNNWTNQLTPQGFDEEHPYGGIDRHASIHSPEWGAHVARLWSFHFR